jgi:hypothetical protein
MSEMRRFGWSWLIFPLASMLAASLATYARIEARSEVPTGILELTMVLVVSTLSVAGKQASEMRAGTLRHVLSYPLQPSLLLFAKLIAFLAIFLIVTAVGFAAVFFVINHTGRQVEIPMFTTAFRLVCVCVVAWSLTIAADSWPRVGLLAVLGLLTTCILVLVYFPPLKKLALPVVLVGSQSTATYLLPATLVYSALFASGLAITIFGLRNRIIQ